MQIQCFATKYFSSLSPLAPVALPSLRETHFWYIVPDEVKDADLLTQYHGLLSPCENKSVFSMGGEMLQKRALLARVLVRSTLSRYTSGQVSPRSLMFKKNTFGKPEVEWQHDKKSDAHSLQFNLSHTTSLIACGVTIDSPIGIDVEDKERKLKNNLLPFARRYFSPNETKYLRGISDPDVQRQEFLKLWTLKEAYVKALGRGYSGAPFKTFAIRFAGTGKCGLQVPGISSSKASQIVLEAIDDQKYLTTNWKFSLIELANSYYVAICVEDQSLEGEENVEMKLKVWKTIPFVMDECVSGTDSVLTLSGFTWR